MLADAASQSATVAGVQPAADAVAPRRSRADRARRVRCWPRSRSRLLAGLVSFASPCVLPLVPGYLGLRLRLRVSGRGRRSLRTRRPPGPAAVGGCRAVRGSAFPRRASVGLSARAGRPASRRPCRWPLARTPDRAARPRRRRARRAHRAWSSSARSPCCSGERRTALASRGRAWPARRCSARPSASAGRRASARRWRAVLDPAPAPTAAPAAARCSPPAYCARPRACRSCWSPPAYGAWRAGARLAAPAPRWRSPASAARCSSSSGVLLLTGAVGPPWMARLQRRRRRLRDGDLAVSRADRHPARGTDPGARPPAAASARQGSLRFALAAADEHAHRAGAAAAARRGHRPRLAVPAARRRPAARSPTTCAENPGTGPWLDRLGLFDVYASPWFAAIYLLLFVSLVGCVVPRAGRTWPRCAAPAAAHPRRLDADARPAPAGRGGRATPTAGARRARGAVLRLAGRYRRGGHRRRTAVVAAESGRLRETGNLLFHLALVGLLVGGRRRSLFGYRGEVLVRRGRVVRQRRCPLRLLRPRRLVRRRRPAAVLVHARLPRGRLRGAARAATSSAPRDFEAAGDLVRAPGEPRPSRSRCRSTSRSTSAGRTSS